MNLTLQDENRLRGPELGIIGSALHHGAAEASAALGHWIARTATISLDAVEQLPLNEATGVLGVSDEPICFCAAEMRGRLTGQLILAFDDASGLALADLVLDQPRGTAGAWGELETSAALETTNILICAYLNAMARVFPAGESQSSEFLPSPPTFSRDFAESLVEFALMNQVIATDQVLLARTRFEIDHSPVDWTLLWVPDAESINRLRSLR